MQSHHSIKALVEAEEKAEKKLMEKGWPFQKNCVALQPDEGVLGMFRLQKKQCAGKAKWSARSVKKHLPHLENERLLRFVRVDPPLVSLFVLLGSH